MKKYQVSILNAFSLPMSEELFICHGRAFSTWQLPHHLEMSIKSSRSCRRREVRRGRSRKWNLDYISSDWTRRHRIGRPRHPRGSGDCPRVGKYEVHPGKRRWGVGRWAGRRIRKCPKWKCLKICATLIMVNNGHREISLVLAGHKFPQKD